MAYTKDAEVYNFFIAVRFSCIAAIHPFTTGTFQTEVAAYVMSCNKLYCTNIVSTSLVHMERKITVTLLNKKYIRSIAS